MEFLSDAILSAVSSPWVYLLIVAVIAIDGFFPPIPSESVVVAAAAIGVDTGTPNPLLVVAFAAIGAVIGDNIAYLIGRSVGTTRFRWMHHPRAVAAFDRARRGLDRRAASMLFVARYIPVGRTAVNLTAGTTGFSYRRFWPLTVLAGFCWAVYSVLIGVLAGHWVRDQPLVGAAIGVVLALALGVVIDRVVGAVAKRRDWYTQNIPIADNRFDDHLGIQGEHR